MRRHRSDSTEGGAALANRVWLDLKQIAQVAVTSEDPEFEQEMTSVLHVYKEVEILNQELWQGQSWSKNNLRARRETFRCAR